MEKAYRPEIFVNNEWKRICFKDFKENVDGANLICRKLGYESGRIKRSNVDTKTFIGEKYYDEQNNHIGYQGKDALILGRCNQLATSLEDCAKYAAKETVRLLDHRCWDGRTIDEIECEPRNKGIVMTCQGVYGNF